ncbi:hypothetical protein [Paenibacillus sp. FSL H3-0333]|uniref:hypothetical protein n=1 Tax=Paenibacillus sp. FSL H3-0333 TaxID=2921373 RepID=UPI0030F5AD14
MKEIDESIELKFLLGQSVDVNGIDVHSPSLKDIVSIGYDKYNHALSSLLFDKSRFPELKNLKETNLELVIHFYSNDDRFRDSLELGSRLVFKNEVSIQISGDSLNLRVGDSIVSSETFCGLQKLIKFANKIPEKTEVEEFNPANSKAKEFIDKIMGDRAKKPQKKPVSNLPSLISGLSWKSPNISILDIGELTIYQLYDGYYRMENIDHYNSILTGIYSGTIDSSKINIQENTWAKIIT